MDTEANSVECTSPSVNFAYDKGRYHTQRDGMPRNRKIDPFLLAVVDDEKGIFSIEGPMVDDRPWMNAVDEAQKAKRPVRCITVGPDAATAEANLVRSFGWKRVSSGSIVSAY